MRWRRRDGRTRRRWWWWWRATLMARQGSRRAGCAGSNPVTAVTAVSARGAAMRDRRRQRHRRRARRTACRRRLRDDHGLRRPDECGNDSSLRRRQEVTLPRRRWRRQHDKFAGPWRQEKYRRRRRRRVVASPEIQHRTINKIQFLRRRRRHAEIDDSEIGRAFELGADHSQPAPGVPNVRTVRVAAQVGPIGRRRIFEHAVPPDHLLAANRDHGGNAPGIAAARMQRQELLIALDGVERERRRISVFNIPVTAHRLFTQVCDRRGVCRRRRVGAHVR